MKINQNGQSNEWCGTHIHFNDNEDTSQIPQEVLVNGQRVSREIGEGEGTNHSSSYPYCSLCDKQCENQWGHNGFPLTTGKVCDVCNDRIIQNRINMVIDTCGRNKGLDDDCPDDPSP